MTGPPASGGGTWPVPAALVARMRAAADTAAWVAGVGDTGAALAAQWALTPDGPPWAGWQSVVWPVRRGPAEFVLKIGHRADAAATEAAVLDVWDGQGVVRRHDFDAARHALLLERLEGDRSLADHPDDDAACRIVGRLLAGLHRAAGPARPTAVATIAMEAVRLTAAITAGVARTPSLLPGRMIDQALDTVAGLADGGGRLVHGDGHFENVLGDGRGGWTLIDPWPLIGPPEWELLPVLRNRWAAAVATGDPDAALRRRIDLLCAHLGGDPARARLIAQATAVAGLLHFLPREPGHMFVPPYALQSMWTG